MSEIKINGNGDILRIGAVSFLNARVLTHRFVEEKPIWGSSGPVKLSELPPAQLASRLDKGEFHAALVPSIDYQRSQRDWAILPAGAIGSAGEVLTVRVFSRCQGEKVRRLVCDDDSHTSVVLAQILWQLRYGRRLEIVPLGKKAVCEDDFSDQSAVLLIGDKVLGQLGLWPWELDLGWAWEQLNSLPFVYAFWATGVDADKSDIFAILQEAYLQGIRQIDKIAALYGPAHGFDEEQARRYLRKNIRYDFGAGQREGLARFYQLAHQFKLIEQIRPIRVYDRPARWEDLKRNFSHNHKTPKP